MTNNENTFFVLDAQTKLELKKIALREGTTLRELLNKAALEYAQAHKEGNSQHLLDSFQNNEDFAGFPSIALDLKGKRKYIAKVLTKDTKLKQRMTDHLDQWSGILRNE